MLADDKPIFQQIADHISSEILAGTYAEEAQVPSINEFAAFYRINPATANKGINILVNQGILYKKRGIGMFVAAGAREILLDAGRKEFVAQYISPLVAEAKALGITEAGIHAAITASFTQQEVS